MTDLRLHIFGSVKDHVAYARRVCKLKTNYSRGMDLTHDSSRSPWSSGLVGNSDIGRDFPGLWPEVFVKAREAWPEGEDMLNNALAQLKGIELPIPESIRRRQRWSDLEGDEIEPMKVFNSEPYWRGCNKRQAVGGCPTITVLCNNGTSYDHEPESVIWRGIAAMIITDILEDAGYRVELWAARQGDDVFDEKPYNQLTATLIKEAHGPLVKPLLVSVVSGWYYRTIVWLSYYDLEKNERPSGGLGSPRGEISIEAKEAIAGSAMTNHFFEIGQIWNAQECVELIKNTIAEFAPGDMVNV